MDEKFRSALADTCRQLSGQTLPRWQELPDLELYMDQVLALIARYLDAQPGEKSLTASMVNNYVKLGLMPAPVRKKYTRTHLVYLIVICILKPVLPIPSIRRLISLELDIASEEDFYNSFCALYEKTNLAVSEMADTFSRAAEPNFLSYASVFAPALRAQAEQTLAQHLLTAVPPEEEN